MPFGRKSAAELTSRVFCLSDRLLICHTLLNIQRVENHGLVPARADDSVVERQSRATPNISKPVYAVRWRL